MTKSAKYVAMAKEGKTARQIADELGVKTVQVIYEACRRLGQPLRHADKFTNRTSGMMAVSYRVDKRDGRLRPYACLPCTVLRNILNPGTKHLRFEVVGVEIRIRGSDHVPESCPRGPSSVVSSASAHCAAETRPRP